MRAAPRPAPARVAAALAPVPGAARGLRAGLQPRDRLDARLDAEREIAGRARRAVPHRGRRGLLDRLPRRLRARASAWPGAARLHAAGAADGGRRRRRRRAGRAALRPAGRARAHPRRSRPTRHERAAAFADACRINALYMIMRAGSGHIGTTFSVASTSSPGCTSRCWARATTSTSPPRATTRPALYAVLIGLGQARLRAAPPAAPARTACPATPTSPPTPEVVTNTGSLGMGDLEGQGLRAAPTGCAGRSRRAST